MSDEKAPITKWYKDTSGLLELGDSLETHPTAHNSFITANKDFFVCADAGGTPLIDADKYVLRVEGNAIKQPLELSYDAILKLPSHSLIAFLECAGSQRNLFKEVMGQEAKSGNFFMTPWMLGGVGNAVWTGVSLRTILEMAGLEPDAVDVNAKGLDIHSPEGGVSRPIPIEKALDPDTILAYFMNGEPLLPDHGFPLRLLVPGWIGSNSIKWVGNITVSSKKIWVNRNTKNYVFIGPEWPAAEYAPAIGGTITEQNIKSSLALAWGATLQAGKQMLRGIARSANQITRVEWSDDAGTTWTDAQLLEPELSKSELLKSSARYAWTRFEFEWDAPVGEQSIMTRAYDDVGNIQPMEIPYNEEGYLFNAVYQHPLKVVAS